MRSRRALAAPLAFAFALAGAAPASAQPAEPKPPAAPSPDSVDDAAQRFQRGLELYKEGDYKAAQVEFKRAYEVSPNYRVLYNLGQVSYQLRDYASALRSFQAYLEQGGREVPAARRTQLTAEIGRLRTRVGNLVVEADAPGADVSIDDAWVGRTPLAEPVLVSAGQHKVAVLKSGTSAPVIRTVEVGGGDKVELKFELGVTPPPAEAPPPPAAVAKAPPPPPPRPPPDRTPVYIAWGATGALAVGTVVMAVLARGEEGDLEQQREAVPVTRGELEDTRGRMKAFALVTDGLGLATLAGAGVATYLTLRQGAKPQSGAAASPRAVSPWRLGVGPAGVALGGSFLAGAARQSAGAADGPSAARARPKPGRASETGARSADAARPPCRLLTPALQGGVGPAPACARSPERRVAAFAPAGALPKRASREGRTTL